MTDVLVTNALDRAALAVVRDLGRGGHRVIGCTARRPPRWLRSRYCRTFLEFADALPVEELADRAAAAGVEVLLPIGTPDLLRLSRGHASLARRFALAFPGPEAVQAAYDKRRTHDLCRDLGIPVARLLDPREARGPVVVKPRFDIGGARGVRRYADIGQAHVEARQRELVCEYVPGPTEALRCVTLLFDRRSRLVGWFTLRKLRQLPAEAGVAALAESTREPHLVETVLPFFETLGWQGAAEVEFKIDARCGTPKVIEINPRLPGYVRFFLDCGLHLPRLVVEAARGAITGSTAYLVGRRMLNPGLFVKHCRELLAGDRPLAALRHALRDARGARCWHPADITDPAPRIAKFLAKLRPTAR